MPKNKAKPTGKASDETTQRRQKVAKMWWQGYTRQQIADRLSVKMGVISRDVSAIEGRLSPKTERTLKYLQNSAVERLRPIQVLMWEIIEANANDNIKISAARLAKDVEEQVNKVRGIIGERLVEAPDKRLSELVKLGNEISLRAKGDGHKAALSPEGKEDDLPSFLTAQGVEGNATLGT